MIRFCLASMVLAGIAVLGAIAIGKDARAAESAKKLTEADNGKVIKVNVGDLVAISLRSNPTTGYTWQMAKINNTVLEQVGKPKYKGDPNPGGKEGVGGSLTFTLKASKSGKSEVGLIYVRPWEKEKPARTFNTTIEVESK